MSKHKQSEDHNDPLLFRRRDDEKAREVFGYSEKEKDDNVQPKTTQQRRSQQKNSIDLSKN